MFHSAKALVLKKGYREKSHYCLLVALRELYIKSGELTKDVADDFELEPICSELPVFFVLLMQQLPCLV